MAILENALVGPNWALAARQTRRVRKAFRQERKDGLWLALRLRLGVLSFVFCYLLWDFGLDWRQLVNAVDLVAFGLVGWAQYRIAGTRFDRPAVMAMFPLADTLILVVTLFVTSQVEGDVPRVMLDDMRDFSWFLLLLTLQALAYRPWLAAWSGFVTAVCWMGVLLWMQVYSGAQSDFGEVAPAAYQLRTGMAVAYEPVLADLDIWIRESMIALLCGIILAVAAQRSQTMMARAVQAERSRSNLARYFSPSMVDELAEQDRPFGATSEQEIGVLFADIVGFTRFAERSTPEQLIRLLREFHGRVARTVFDHGGTLDKFIGDCVMATFGTPRTSADDATRTIACCRAIAASIEAWNSERAMAGLAPVAIGIGAHYGTVVIGDIGDERRLEFAVLGDTVNVASRLEGLTRELSTTILISDDLVRAAQSEPGSADDLVAEFVRTEPQPLRNRAEPVSLWAWPALPP